MDKKKMESYLDNLLRRIMAEARLTREGATPNWRRDLPINDDQARADLAALYPDKSYGYVRVAAKFRMNKTRDGKRVAMLDGIEVHYGRETLREYLIARIAKGYTRAGFGPVSVWRSPEASAPERRERATIRKRLEAYGERLLHELDGNPALTQQGATISGACMVCGKALSDATSLAMGIGPECRSGATSYVAEAALQRFETYGFVIDKGATSAARSTLETGEHKQIASHHAA